LIFRNQCCTRKTKKGSRFRQLLDVSQSVLHKENQKREPLPSVACFLRNQCCTRKTEKGSRSHPSLEFSQSMLHKENQRREPLPSVASRG
jgi:hypothetical protein